ncbi:unnamed protein product, partial [Brenthis ino]
MAKTETEKLNRISQDVSSIKEDISQIKATTDYLSTERNELKRQLAYISDFKATIEKKVETIKNKTLSLKPNTTAQQQLQQSFLLRRFCIRDSRATTNRKELNTTRNRRNTIYTFISAT